MSEGRTMISIWIGDKQLQYSWESLGSEKLESYHRAHLQFKGHSREDFRAHKLLLQELHLEISLQPKTPFQGLHFLRGFLRVFRGLLLLVQILGLEVLGHLKETHPLPHVLETLSLIQTSHQNPNKTPCTEIQQLQAGLVNPNPSLLVLSLFFLLNRTCLLYYLKQDVWCKVIGK